MINKFELEHIGINMNSEKEANELAEFLCNIFNLNFRHGQKSEFAGPYFECMKNPYLGKNGHIAMKTENLDNAIEELEAKNMTFNMETAAYDQNGKIKNIYLNGEFGGFAIHILRK
ncbi:MAG: 2-dehydro-3-deoxyphosphogluconate aldolase [Enterococcus sp.]